MCRILTGRSHSNDRRFLCSPEWCRKLPLGGRLSVVGCTIVIFEILLRFSDSLSPAGDSLYAYKFSRDSNGKPVFTLAGKTARTFAGKSVPTVTSKSIP
jgi:hypothetical protein